MTQHNLYEIEIVPPFGDELEIVLPGRTFAHAKRAAEILLATRGHDAFEPMQLVMNRDLGAIYARNADKLLGHLLHAYDAVYHSAQERRFMAELFDHLEYQIEIASHFVTKIDHRLLQTHTIQRASRQLPDHVIERDPLGRKAHNANAPSPAPKGQAVQAAKRLITTIEKDIRETAALSRQLKREHIDARIAISRAASERATAVRARVNEDFAQHYREVGRLYAEKALRPEKTHAADRQATLQAVMKSHQKVLRHALKPVHDHKREALAQADQLVSDFHKRNQQLSKWETEWLQQQWRQITASHAREKHQTTQPAPSSTPPKTPPDTPFMERLATRARERAAPSPSPEQDNAPTPEP